MADSVITPPLSPVGSSGAQSNVPSTRAPLERSPHSVDLEITLEDKNKVHRMHTTSIACIERHSVMFL